MKPIGELMQEKKPEKIPKHELAASVDEIIKLLGESKKYGYGYWLAKVKKSGKDFGGIMYLLKDMQNLDPKFSKGGWLTNRLIGKNATNK